ncbi:glycoside hydrolase family 15 protein [Streptomyces sp. NPDC088768]|uniref:glycoside hydrolase family 15 protein n=1 Tax=Streptomyces sp. NPDC088768 TaxID=3365894 RepID=UPI003820E3C1
MAEQERHGAYPPIAEHGLIGDLRTAALVAVDGSVDWFCAPRFDSPSVFGALLDAREGGRWRIAPVADGEATYHQFYFPDTNILVTRMLTEDGIVEVQDFMPLLRPKDEAHRQRLVRRVVCVRGRMPMRMGIAPRMDYGRAPHEARATAYGAEFAGPAGALALRTRVPLRVEGRDAHGEFTLSAGESAAFVLEDAREDTGETSAAEVEELFLGTVAYWRGWLSRSGYAGRWRERVHRSVLTLKLLTHEPSGAVIAAPTLGLPERVGGERNWDYRYVWIRDAAFSLYALLRLGFTEEADAFTSWLTRLLRKACVSGEGGPLRALYTIDGEAVREEVVLDHWEGYRGSAPCRVGNGAKDQLQLDIFGELIDSVYLFNKYGKGISYEAWTDLCTLLDWLLDHWDQPDESIWETRAGRQRHTYSRLMCWVAVERMVRVARQRGLPGDLGRWMATRDTMYRQIIEEGWDEEAGTFTQRLRPGDCAEAEEAVGGDAVVDAALLLMPMVKFLSPTDPRFLGTVEAIRRDLVADSLVFRYDPRLSPDGLEGAEGTFSICSFWWVEALTRTGDVEGARLALEKMFTYANHVGLYAEQIGPTGEQLGNFPQAFTHLALISAAVNLDRQLGG